MILLFLAACFDEPCQGEPSLELGTGERAFEPLAEGADLRLNWGPQGGFHVYASLKAEGIEQGSRDLADPANPLVSLVVVEGEEVLAGYEDYPQHLLNSDGSKVLIGETLIFYVMDPAEVAGKEVTVEATLEDRVCGVVLEDRRGVTLVE